MLDFESTQVNERFVEMIKEGGQKKTAAEKRSAQYLKAQIYEDSFMSRIVPPTPISPSDCDRSVDSPNFQKVIDKEFTEVGAITTGTRGMADYQFVEDDRYAVRFYKIDSDEYNITEGELRSKQQPIPELIRHHVAFEIRKKMDMQFKGMCEYALKLPNGQKKTKLNVDNYNQANGTDFSTQVLNYTGSGADQLGDEKIVTPELLTELKNILDDRAPEYLTATTFLMTKSQYNYISTWVQENMTGGSKGPGMSGGITEDFWKDGYKYDELLDCRVVTTRKTDVIAKNEVYVFTEPDYLGHHFTFNDDRFAIEKHFDEMTWKGWRSWGFSIGNEYALGKLELRP